MKNLQWPHQAATATVVEELEWLEYLRKQRHPYQVQKTAMDEMGRGHPKLGSVKNMREQI